MTPPRETALGLMLGLILGAGVNADEWPHYAGDAARSGSAERAARALDRVRWSVAPVADEEYVWHSAPVVYGGRVFVNARYFMSGSQLGNRVIAYGISDGARLWATPVEADEYDSWSSPAVDVRNGAVLLGVGRSVYALDTATGEIRWQTATGRVIIDASPAVTDDLWNGGTPVNRLLITDFASVGRATLYAINVDPFNAARNPYDPGEIVWTANLPGAVANTPAYVDGVVYVASTGGVVKALDVTDGSILWETDVALAGYAAYANLTGGVTVHDDSVYAASYSFYGTGNNSGLFKLDASTGAITWVVPCERTSSIPVVTCDERIYLAAGLDGFGSVVKLQAFEDHGDSASQLWDTYMATGGDLIVGGWTHQPAHARGYVYVGTPPPPVGFDFFGPYTDLRILDVSKTPTDPDFIVAHHHGAGGAVAIADGTVYSFGPAGLFAFDPSPVCLADLDGDGRVFLSDLSILLGAYGTSRGDAGFDSDADLNRDGRINLSDLSALVPFYGAYCP